MRKKQEEFLKDAILELIRCKVGVNLANKTQVTYISGEDGEDCKCSGYFDDGEMVLACAIGKPQKLWLQIFIHEFCHFTQWRDNVSCWALMTRTKADEKMEEWISTDSRLTQGEIRAAIKTVRDMELDCEKRVVKLVKERELGIDLDDYIRRANAYLFFYAIVLENRKWYDSPPYEVDEIVRMMPTQFASNYNKLPPKFRTLVEKYCYK